MERMMSAREYCEWMGIDPGLVDQIDRTATMLGYQPRAVHVYTVEALRAAHEFAASAANA